MIARFRAWLRSLWAWLLGGKLPSPTANDPERVEEEARSVNDAVGFFRFVMGHTRFGVGAKQGVHVIVAGDPVVAESTLRVLLDNDLGFRTWDVHPQPRPLYAPPGVSAFVLSPRETS